MTEMNNLERRFDRIVPQFVVYAVMLLNQRYFSYIMTTNGLTQKF